MTERASPGSESWIARIFPGPAYGWVIVCITFLSIAMVFGARFCLGLFLPYMPEALDTSAGAVSGAIALSMLAAGILQPVSGYFIDRLGGRTVLAVGLGFAGLALCGTAFATSLWQLTLLMGLMSSVGYAAVSPVSVTSIVSSWFERNRGAALGVATSGTKVAMIILPPVIAALITFQGWRTAIFVVGLMILLLIPAVLIWVRRAPSEAPATNPIQSGGGAFAPEASDDFAGPAASPKPDTTPFDALKIPTFWLISISLFANGLIMNLVFVHLPSFVLNKGYDAAQAAIGLTLVGGIGILGTVVTGAISDWLGRRIVLLIMFGARGLTTLFVVLMPGPVSFLTFVVIFGLLGYGAIGVVGALARELFGRRSIGSILGLAYVFNQVGGAIGVFVGGASLEWTGGFDAALWFAVGTTMISVICIAFLRES